MWAVGWMDEWVGGCMMRVGKYVSEWIAGE